jgi:hypothetical protein
MNQDRRAGMIANAAGDRVIPANLISGLVRRSKEDQHTTDEKKIRRYRLEGERPASCRALRVSG